MQNKKQKISSTNLGKFIDNVSQNSDENVQNPRIKKNYQSISMIEEETSQLDKMDSDSAKFENRKFRGKKRSRMAHHMSESAIQNNKKETELQLLDENPNKSDNNTQKKTEDKKKDKIEEIKEDKEKMQHLKRLRALYGVRYNFKIDNDFLDLGCFNDKHNSDNNHGLQNSTDSCSPNLDLQEEMLEIVQQKEKPQKKTFKDYLIIPADSKWKSFFDIWILFLVGYSCFTSMYYVAFTTPTQRLHVMWDTFVEYNFYVDVILNFFSAYYHPDTKEEIKDHNSIVKKYIYGWFPIDFISVFPFNEFMNSGALTKLFRLFRMPRLIKLIDISRFKNLLKKLEGDQSDDETIIQQNQILYMYNMLRLIIIAIGITYFIACVFIFISKELNPEKDIQEGNTFVQTFGLGEDSVYSDQQQLIIISYYALTTLSTVGYGDMYAISRIEMITAVISMLGGVAFFSFIMGNFVDIIQSQKAKFGSQDKSEDLQKWMISLARFTNQTPLSQSLVEDIENNMNHFWTYNRLSCFDSPDGMFNIIPTNIKEQIAQDYLFPDIFDSCKRFFNSEFTKDSEFMYEISLGLLPRRFMAEDPIDKIIYEEDQEVSEMYFIVKGFIGFGYTYWGGKHNQSSITIAKQQKGRQVICDHYVVNRKRCNFYYIAIEETHCYALTRKFLHYKVFPKYQNYFRIIQSESLSTYNLQIFKPVSELRKKQMAAFNKNAPRTIDIKFKQIEIPSAYNTVRFYREKYKQKRKFKEEQEQQKPIHIMRQSTKVFAQSYNKFMNNNQDHKYEDLNDRKSMTESSFEKNIDEEPESVAQNISNQIMNMDDRDKAGDPDSNPEIDDDDDDMESNAISSKVSSKISEIQEPKKQVPPIKKSDTFIKKYMGADQSVMMDHMVFDIGTRLSKVISSYQSMIIGADYELYHLVKEVENNNVI